MAAFTTVNDPLAYFNTILYTGTGSDTAFTGVGFQPDFVWCKIRDAIDSSALDTSPTGVTTMIHSNSASITTTAVGLTSFDADGFTADTRTEINYNTKLFISWNWLAGTTTGIAGSPSITPTSYSFNQDAGFSIIAYEGNEISGATIPHGLTAAPQCVLTKTLDSGSDWGVYHSHMDATAPEDYAAKFNSTAIRTDQIAMWNDTAPSSTLVTLGNEDRSNDADSMVAWCFTGIAGYSKFGSYRGNGNTDGQFIFTGFRPAMIWTKDADYQSGNWNIWSDKIKGYNPQEAMLTTNQSAIVQDKDLDIFANGFKPRDAGQSNELGSTYIYMAWANSPFVNSNGVPTNAR